MLTRTPKLFTVRYGFFIALCWLISHTILFSRPLPLPANHARPAPRSQATANRPPVVAVTTTTRNGNAPLSVTFTGSGSSDPDGDPITYEWDFGDGATSTAANPVHVFVITRGRNGTPVLSYSVKLTVRDNQGGSTPSESLFVSLTNPPPTASINSPANNSQYNLDKPTTYTLNAAVTDDSPSTLSYLWQVRLYHNGQGQLLTTRSDANPIVAFSPAGCDVGEDYYYVVSLKLTDIGGITVQDSVRINPNCNSPKLTVTGLTATTLSTTSVRLNWTNPTLAFDDVLVVAKAAPRFNGIPPAPFFTANPSFTGNGSLLPTGGKVMYQGTGTSVTITDLTAGPQYFFRVYTRKGDTWTAGVEVSVPINRPPVAVASATSLTGASPLSVTFTGDKSTDPDGDKLFYSWAFSDGTVVNDTNPVKVFSIQPGKNGVGFITNYTAQLTVRDTKGQPSVSQVFNIVLNQPTSATTVEAGKCYRIVGRVSGKVLGVEGSSLADGAQVRQRTDGSQLSQRWRFTLINNGFYKVEAVHSQKALDVQWGSQDNGIGIQQWSFGGEWTYQQQFALTRNSDGSFQITARHSGKVLEVQNGNTDEGGMVIQNTPGNSANQQWLIEERACTTSPPSSTTSTPPTTAVSIDPAKCYRIQSRSSGLILNIPSGSGDDGVVVRQNTNTDKAWQKWKFYPADGTSYRISVLHNQKCIEVTNSSTQNGASLEQWTWWGGAHQQWTASKNADGFFVFANRSSGKVMEVKNASVSEGGEISQNVATGGTNQQWSLTETTCPTGARVGAEEPTRTLSLSPNPARDYVMLDLSPAVGQPVYLSLYDLLGHPHQQTFVAAAPAEPYRLSVGQLPDGLYLLRISPVGLPPSTLRLLIRQ